MTADVIIAGIAIDVDRIDDEYGTVCLYDESGRKIAELYHVARITIGTTYEALCANSASKEAT
jgi:hypothetical protein